MKIPDEMKVAASVFTLSPAMTALAVADYLLNRPVPAEEKPLGGVSGTVVKQREDAVRPRRPISTPGVRG